jgi:predicted GTPase
MTKTGIIIDNPTELCRERLLELAGHHRLTKVSLPENHHRTIRLLESFAGVFYGIEHFSAMREVVRSEVHNLRSSLGNRPLSCAIIGEFSAGKSSVINALVGRDDFLPVNLTETTALISKLEYSPFPRVELELLDGSRLESSLADYRRLVDQNADSSLRQKVTLVKVYVDYPPLKKISIFDTPGLNSKILEHERTTIHYISKVDVVFWVFKANQPASGSELKYLETIKSYGRPVYAIINKIDTVRGFDKNRERWDEEMQQVMDVFHHHCGSVIERFIPLSALEALKGLHEVNQERIHGSNIAELRSVIEDEIAGRTEKIKQERLATAVAHYAGLGKAMDIYLNDLLSPWLQGLHPIRERLGVMEAEAAGFESGDRTKGLDNIRKPWR